MGLANLYLDEDVTVVLARILVGRGFDALRTRDAGKLGKTDEEQLVCATESNRVIFTHNRRHFEALHARFVERQLEHSGILISGQREVYEMARRVALALHAVPADICFVYRAMVRATLRIRTTGGAE